MEEDRSRLVRGLLMASSLAGCGLYLAKLPGIKHVGPLTVTMLLGLGWRLAGQRVSAGLFQFRVPASFIMRAAIVMLGVRLNFDVIAHAGIRILLLDTAVIGAGLIGIAWLGRYLGLETERALLIAVDSSICGASAVAATAPALRARDDDAAVAISLGSLIGAMATLALIGLHYATSISAPAYGLLAGSMLHEVAQVMAAVVPFPDAVEIGTTTKLTRMVLLVPVVFALRAWANRRHRCEDGAKAPTPWFVFGFVGTGAANTWAHHLLPTQHVLISRIDDAIVAVATFLLAVAMAAMGQQIDFGRLGSTGMRTITTAVLGWIGLVAVAAAGVWLLSR